MKLQYNRHPFSLSLSLSLSLIISLLFVPLNRFCAPEIMRGDPYSESCDVYSFGILLIDMATEEDIVSFFTERFKQFKGKKKAPSITRALRAISEDGWRPHHRNTRKLRKSSLKPLEEGGAEQQVAAVEEGMGEEEELLEDPLSFAPSTIRTLIDRCCDHDPKKRPTFAAIIASLFGEVAREIQEAPEPFVRHLPLDTHWAATTVVGPEAANLASGDASNDGTSGGELGELKTSWVQRAQKSAAVGAKTPGSGGDFRELKTAAFDADVVGSAL